MRRLLAALLSTALSAPALAAPVCRLRGRPWIEGRVRGSGAPPARAVDARLGQEIELAVITPGTLDGRPVVFGEIGRGRTSFTAAGCGPLEVAWRRVEPTMEHVRTRAPNRDISVYANAVVFGPSHGKWIGHDRIEHVETPLLGAGPLLVVRDAAPGPAAGVMARAPAQQPLGVMRVAATVSTGGASLSTPDARDAPDGLLSERVFRYSFRGGDDFLGWLTSYFNVPYLFGSAGAGARNQAERYLGADCADVLVAALRRSGHRMEYTSVGGLVGALRPAGAAVVLRPCLAEAAACPQEGARLHFGADVRPGDLLALDYVDSTDLPRSWDHIGVLVEDRGPGGRPDGVLGPEDLFGDTGSAAGLKFAPLGEQGVIRVQALRP